MAPSAPLHSLESLVETLRRMKSEAWDLMDRAKYHVSEQEFKILLFLKAAAKIQDCLKFIVDHRRQLGEEEALCRDQRATMLNFVRDEVDLSNDKYEQSLGR
ncbi:hypothetical protein MY11210_008056 [Beauveria gryllotalpidicola]